MNILLTGSIAGIVVTVNFHSAKNSIKQKAVEKYLDIYYAWSNGKTCNNVRLVEETKKIYFFNIISYVK